MKNEKLSFLNSQTYSFQRSKVPGKGAFYYINHHNSGTFSGLPDSIARNFEASWGRKELYTSKEGPIIHSLE